MQIDVRILFEWGLASRDVTHDVANPCRRRERLAQTLSELVHSALLQIRLVSSELRVQVLEIREKVRDGTSEVLDGSRRQHRHRRNALRCLGCSFSLAVVAAFPPGIDVAK